MESHLKNDQEATAMYLQLLRRHKNNLHTDIIIHRTIDRTLLTQMILNLKVDRNGKSPMHIIFIWLLISQQVYDKESVLKQLLELKGRHIQDDARVRILMDS